MDYQINCPECGSFNVEEYDNYSLIKSNHQESYFRCNDCGFVWKEKLPLIEDKNKKQREIFETNVNKLKKERLQYLKWGKIRMDDIINTLIDLFEFGGGKFSKRTKRKIKSKKKGKN